MYQNVVHVRALGGGGGGFGMVWYLYSCDAAISCKFLEIFARRCLVYVDLPIKKS